MANTKLSTAKLPEMKPKEKEPAKKLGLLTPALKRKMYCVRLRLEYIQLLDDLTKKLKSVHYAKISKGDVLELALHVLKNVDKLDKNVIARIKDECWKSS